MSLLKPILKTKSTTAKTLFIISLVLAGPVSFLLYDYYITWSQSSSKAITWYLAFFYDMLGAWGGVVLSLTAAIVCYLIGMKIHKQKQMYYWK